MIKFKIPFRLPSYNEFQNENRKNRYAGAKMKKQVESAIILILNTQKFRISSPVHISFVWHEPNAKRDKDNVAFAKKFILDALQKAGKLENDNNKFVQGFTDRFVYGSDEGVEVEIVEAIND